MGNVLWEGAKIGKIRKIGNVFACWERISGAMAKWTAGLDSAHQTGQTTPPSDVLIVDEDAHGKGLKNCDVEDVYEYEELIEIWQNGWHHWIGGMK